MKTAHEILEIFNRYLEALPYDREPRSLYEPIRYELSLGGKRIRPSLMMMAYNLYKEDVETILPQACALETYHNHTLLHDDLMDRASVRRGQPTVHVKWDDNTAILSGDAMLLVACQRMLNCSPELMPKVQNLFVETAIEICEGQQYDMDFETRMDVREEEYIEMIRLKTSVLLACATKMGAILAGAPEEDAENLYKFGEQMGLAFQLQDDLLDVYGDPAVFGKQIGGDILCNKKTFMLINAFNLANPTQQAQLKAWIDKTDFVPAEKIQAVTAIYDAVGIKALCLDKIEQLFAQSLDCLAKVKVDETKKAELKAFADKLLKRNK